MIKTNLSNLAEGMPISVNGESKFVSEIVSPWIIKTLKRQGDIILKNSYLVKKKGFKYAFSGENSREIKPNDNDYQLINKRLITYESLNNGGMPTKKAVA